MLACGLVVGVVSEALVSVILGCPLDSGIELVYQI